MLDKTYPNNIFHNSFGSHCSFNTKNFIFYLYLFPEVPIQVLKIEHFDDFMIFHVPIFSFISMTLRQHFQPCYISFLNSDSTIAVMLCFHVHIYLVTTRIAGWYICTSNPSKRSYFRETFSIGNEVDERAKFRL